VACLRVFRDLSAVLAAQCSHSWLICGISAVIRGSFAGNMIGDCVMWVAYGMYRALHQIHHGAATISRLLKITGLVCRKSSLLKGSFAKETCNFKEPTTIVHYIMGRLRLVAHLRISAVISGSFAGNMIGDMGGVWQCIVQ